MPIFFSRGYLTAYGQIASGTIHPDTDKQLMFAYVLFDRINSPRSIRRNSPCLHMPYLTAWINTNT